MYSKPLHTNKAHLHLFRLHSFCQIIHDLNYTSPYLQKMVVFCKQINASLMGPCMILKKNEDDEDKYPAYCPQILYILP